LKVTEFEQGMSAACSEMSEEQILHSASSIIRRVIELLSCRSNWQAYIGA
jgi:3-phenylpropionate/cinnamic acid dioxygenase small subunit